MALQAGGRTLDLRGSPAPNPVDWFGRNRLERIGGDFSDTVTLFENVGTRERPFLAAGKKLEAGGKMLKMGLCMIQPRLVFWHKDGHPSLIVAEKDGTVSLVENLAPRGAPPKLAAPRYLEQVDPHLKSGALSRPVAVDWNGDGKLDILVNSIWGEVLWCRNIGTRTRPALAAAQPVEVEWQGPPPKPEWNWWNPREKQLVTRWRTTPKVVDWNRDGLPDLVMLDHEGCLAFYERVRQQGALKLKPPARIFLGERGEPLKLRAGPPGRSGRRKIELADWDGDGDLDLMVDSENAAWYENTGAHERPVFVWRGNLVGRNLAGHNPAPSVADGNGDGRLDLIIGAENGFFYYFDHAFLNRTRRGAGSKTGRSSPKAGAALRYGSAARDNP